MPVGACFGCTTLAGIDGEYVAITAAAGTQGSSAGAVGSGGADAVGGASAGSGSGGEGAAADGAVGAAGTGGAGGTGGTSDASACEANQKLCGTECVAPGPENGCSSSSCRACPPVTIAHAYAICSITNDCGMRCEDGYVVSAQTCVRAGSGGTGGTGGASGSGGISGSAGSGGTSGSAGSGGSGGGSGGSGGTCDLSRCPPCKLLDGEVPCCTIFGGCGCMFPIVGQFYCPP